MLHPAPSNIGNYMKKEELRNFFLLHFQRWRHKHIYLFPALHFLSNLSVQGCLCWKTQKKYFQASQKTNKQQQQKKLCFLIFHSSISKCIFRFPFFSNVETNILDCVGNSFLCWLTLFVKS